MERELVMDAEFAGDAFGDISREEVEELLTALEGMRGELASRLQEMTSEATELWTVTARQKSRISELEGEVSALRAAASDPRLAEAGANPGEVSHLRRVAKGSERLRWRSEELCRATEQQLLKCRRMSVDVAPSGATEPAEASLWPRGAGGGRDEGENALANEILSQRGRIAALQTRLAALLL